MCIIIGTYFCPHVDLATMHSLQKISDTTIDANNICSKIQNDSVVSKFIPRHILKGEGALICLTS